MVREVPSLLVQLPPLQLLTNILFTDPTPQHCIIGGSPTQCIASGSLFPFTSFIKNQTVITPTIDQNFANLSAEASAHYKDKSTKTINTNQNYNSLSVEVFTHITLQTEKNPLKIDNLLIADVNSSLYVKNTNNYNTEIKTVDLKHNTFLTLQNAINFKTSIFNQNQDSSIILPSIERIDAGEWNFLGDGSCSQIEGTHGDYRFNTLGDNKNRSSIIINGADKIYAGNVASNNIYLQTDTLAVKTDLTLGENGRMSVKANKSNEVNVTVNGTVDIRNNSQVCLASGDYYFNNLTLGSNVHIDPIGNGTVRIFVNGTFTDASTGVGAFFNQGGDPSQLLLYTKNAMNISANTNSSGLIISEGDITLGSNNSEIHGAVIANNSFDLKNDNHVIYDGHVNAIGSKDSSFTCATSYPQTKNYSISHRCDFALHVAHSCPHPAQSITTGPPSTYVSGLFDAWETSKSINDRNITTKIAAKDFNLRLASLTSSDDATEIKTDIKVKYFLKDMLTSKVLGTINEFDANTTAEITAQFQNITSAHKDVNVIFQTCANYDGTLYTLYPYTNCSSDCSSNAEQTSGIPCYRYFENKNNFAIRPDHFGWGTIPTNLRAGNDINVTLQALNYADNFTSDYNETLQIQGSSPSAEYKDEKSACYTGALTVTSATFVNGEANVTFSYSEVGDLNITLTDTNGSEFAHVDAQDTSDSERLITPATQLFTLTPDHFNIDATLSNSVSNFTYISNDLSESVKLDMNITAKSEANVTTKNYNKNCYAQNFDLNLSYLIDGVSDGRQVLYKELNNPDYNRTETNLNANNFKIDNNGTASLKFFINFDRNVSNALNPFVMQIQAINVLDANNTLGRIPQTLDTNATFIYGRTHAPRKRFVGSSGDDFIYYEAHCDGNDSFNVNCDKSLLPNGINSTSTDDPRWFKNTSHTTASGNAGSVNQKGSSNAVTSGTLSGTSTITVPLTYDGTKGYPYKATMENNASSWLIYNKYNANATKNEFEVEFLNSGDWAGDHETNTTTETNSSAISNRRVMW